MNNTSKPRRGFSNFGFSTIVFSFVMICVVTFAILALTTANSDYKLSQKMADNNSAYYKAEEKACEHLAVIDEILITAYSSSTDETDYYTSVKESFSSLEKGIYSADNRCYYYTETISEHKTLEIKLKIIYPANETDNFFTILEWKTVQEENLPDEDILDLMD